MKLYHYGPWTIYVTFDSEGEPRGYKTNFIYGHQMEATLPPHALIYAHINSGHWEGEEYTTKLKLADYPDIRGQARFTLRHTIYFMRESHLLLDR